MKQTNGAVLTLAVIVALLALISLVVVVSKVAVTGNAVDTGTANLTIVTKADLVFTTDNVNWGSGAVDTNKTLATLVTNGTVIDGNWSNVSHPLVLENEGNVDIAVYLKASKNASAFLGGTNPVFKLKVSDNEPGSCSSTSGIAFANFASVTTSDQLACPNMLFVDQNDTLNVDVELGVPYDSLTSSQGSVITATGVVV